jgi:hypothetical protein
LRQRGFVRLYQNIKLRGFMAMAQQGAAELGDAERMNGIGRGDGVYGYEKTAYSYP